MLLWPLVAATVGVVTGMIEKPEVTPQLCAAFLSCSRLHLLNRTINAFVQYMQSHEPNITYQIALVDNGSGEQLTSILQRLPIDIYASSKVNVGIAAGMNILYFGLCRNSPYIITLEEDWEARLTWPLSLPSITMSIEILRHDPTVLEVWLRDFDYGLRWHQNRSAWLETSSGRQYRRQYQRNGVWGAYTNGASVKDSSRLRDVGFMKGVNGELNYAVRVGQKGYASAHFCPLTDKRCDGRFQSSTWVFRHIGDKQRSIGHQYFERRVGEKSPDW
jgi:hypothetical protein